MIKDTVRPARLDWIGTLLSMSCAVHCLIFPVLISLGSLASLGNELHEVTETCFLVLTLGVGLWSFTTSYPVHQKSGPLILLGISFVLITMARLSHDVLIEPALSISGAALIAFAHIINHRFSKKVAR